MVAQEFIDYIEKFKITDYVGMADFADRFNYLFTSVVILLCITIITVKQYFSSSLACYIPNSPTGHDFDKYVNNYCWVHGTIPLYSWEKTPQDKEWEVLDKTRRLNYYQWVPFVLGLQCIMFYLPRVLWLIICYNRTGTDLENIVDTASKAAQQTGSERVNTIDYVVNNLDDMFFTHREIRHGRVAQLKRKVGSLCKFCCFNSSLGTMLIGYYFFIKILSFANAVGQLYIMKSFLGFNSSLSDFGLTILKDIHDGKDWQDNLVFPRVSHCVIKDIRITGFANTYTAQCALPVNMLNEKIYIFLWFWTVFICILLAISIPLWFYRLSSTNSRTTFVKRCLRISEEFADDTQRETKAISLFINGFLRPDGVFIIKMISINAGDIVTTEIITKLWALYKKKYYNMDFRQLNDRPPAPAPPLMDDERLYNGEKSVLPPDSFNDKNYV